jgi:nucleotide-binding universal stress UspA family protein
VSEVRRIFVGASGSANSLRALRYAAGLAQDEPATLIPVHAWVPPGGELADARHPSAYLRQIWRDAAWQRLWKALDAAWGGLPPGLSVVPHALRGQAGPVLTAVADRPGDLLVVGAGRRGAIRHLLKSRVSRYCLAHASCPVVAVPPAALAQDAGHGLRGWRAWHRALDAGRADLAPRGH